MSLLLDLAYAAAAIAAAPAVALKARRTGKYRTGWPDRFGFGPPLPPRPRDAPLLLLHCVSVGELLSVSTLVQRLLAADRALHIALSTTTDTGTARALKLYPPAINTRVHAVRFPLDFSFSVEQFFDRLRPTAVALVELETWPNFLAIAQSRRIPVALINGRISEKSLPRYRIIRPVMQSMLSKLTWIAAQNASIAGRFCDFGAAPERLFILPTLKYDNAHIARTIPGQELLAAAMKLAPDHHLFVAGSTGPGEEAPILEAYLALRDKHPDLRLAIAPRHPEVVPQVIAAITSRKLTPILRSQNPDPPAALPADQIPNQKSKIKNDEVFVLNTLGELRKLYALAFAAFVGRSLFKKGGGGSDMIEVAALAKPCCFGPFTSNFAEAVELLTAERAALVTPDAPSIQAALAQWLNDPAAAAQTGARAQQLIRTQQGSTDHYVARLLALCGRPPQVKTQNAAECTSSHPMVAKPTDIHPAINAAAALPMMKILSVEPQ